MKIKILLLGLTLFLLGAAAQAKAEEEETAARVTVKATNEAKIKESIKPKRDASLSIGGSGGGGSSSVYHGPSHKYLPPSVVIGYDSYSGGGGGGSRHHTHGNALSSASGYDFGSLADSYHYRHHGGGGTAGGGSSGGVAGGVYHTPTKVETYIVQTEHSSSGSNGAGGLHSGGGAGGGGSHQYQHGYKYVSPGSGSYANSGAGSLSLSHHGIGGGGGGGSSSLGVGHHKLHTVYALPAPAPVHYQPSAHSGYSSFLHKPSSGAAAHGHGHGYELGGLGLGSGAAPNEHVSHSHEHGSGSMAGLGYHYAPTSTPVVEHVEETPAHGYFSSGGGGSGGGVGHQTFFGSQQGSSSSGGSSSIEAATGSDTGGFGGTGLIAGYNYAVPTLPFPIVRKPQLLTSYGAPAVYEEHQQQEQHNSHGHGHGQSGDDVTPIYALGHKGLGHFSYTSSKPQALHTDIVAALSAGAGASASSSGHASSGYSHGGHAHGISKAPFRPSVFLGAKHESSSGAAVTGDDVYYATPTAQYLPPTSGGYEYQSPSLIYGAPSHSGDSATPIFEPESTYLPPAHH